MAMDLPNALEMRGKNYRDAARALRHLGKLALGSTVGQQPKSGTNDQCLEQWVLGICSIHDLGLFGQRETGGGGGNFPPFIS